MNTAATSPAPTPEHSPIAGSVLPIQRAEELLSTLPGVISARIVAGPSGAVEEIHVLTTDEVGAKQTVRNIESALIAHLGMRVSHKKISVATSSDSNRPTAGPRPPGTQSSSAPGLGDGTLKFAAAPTGTDGEPLPAVDIAKRRLYFEDVEVRRSRAKGVACRVTLKKAGASYIGEAEGLEIERLRIELAARAAVSAICQAEGDDRALALEGCKAIDAFDRSFVFVGVSGRVGRESVLLTGSAEVRESAETASVLAVLDATNRWIELAR